MRKIIIDSYTKEELGKIVNESASLAEVASKLGYSTTKGNNNTTIKKRLEKYNISTEHFFTKTPTKRTTDNVFCENSNASQQTLRRWFYKNLTENICCNICGQPPIWNNKELTMILDHINGNKHDNRLCNLRLICPNCNQQLDTTKHRNTINRRNNMKDDSDNNLNENTHNYKYNYCIMCGKEISTYSKLCVDCYSKSRRKIERPTKDKLKEMIRFLPFTTIATTFNVTDNTICKWCDSYGLPRKSKEIKSIPNDEWELI